MLQHIWQANNPPPFFPNFKLLNTNSTLQNSSQVLSECLTILARYMSMFIVTGEGVIGIEPVNSAHSQRVRGGTSGYP